MVEKLKLPKFASEAEEAQWWFDHRDDEVVKAFEDAAAGGKLRTGSVASLARKEDAAADATPATTIPLDPDDISRARALAAQRGLRYQTYLKMLVHEALAAEERKLTR
jgi:predicted DNA binding CopG/RHH family protein